MTRREQAARAAELRAEGLVYREIAERMGVSVSYVGELVIDPAGRKVKARKRSYRGTCDTCGGPTDGGSGWANAPTRCLDCRTWTRDAVIEAFVSWFDETGRPPRCEDVRDKPGRLPHDTTVKRLFGSWCDGLEAAGLPIFMDRRASTLEAWRRRALAGEPVADIAADYGVTPGAIYVRLRNHGVSLRAVRRAA